MVKIHECNTLRSSNPKGPRVTSGKKQHVTFWRAASTLSQVIELELLWLSELFIID